MSRVHACLFYAVCISTVLCHECMLCSVLCVDLQYCVTSACTVDTLYMYPIPKCGRRVQSQAQRSCMLSNCTSPAVQDVGTRNHTVIHNVHVRRSMYTSQFEHEYESSLVLLSQSGSD